MNNPINNPINDPAKQLDLDDLKNLRKELSKTINIIREEAFEARETKEEEKKITEEQFKEAQNKWQDLQLEEMKLSGLLMSLELDFLLDTNADSPMSKIIKATTKLKEAAKKIKQFQDFLDAVADVIEIFGAVIKAIKK